MTKKNKNLNLSGYKNFMFDSFRECKIRTIILFVFVLITILTGIIVAIRTHSDWGTVNGLGIIDTRTGALTSSFFTRFLSMLFIYLILFGSSYLPYLFPIGLIFLSYRAYLLGLNVTLIIILHGFSGAIISILVALPCQLIALLTLTIFYLLLCRTTKDYRCFGGSRINNQRLTICIVAVVILLTICIVESILLLIFNAKIILII